MKIFGSMLARFYNPHNEGKQLSWSPRNQLLECVRTLAQCSVHEADIKLKMQSTVMRRALSYNAAFILE